MGKSVAPPRYASRAQRVSNPLPPVLTLAATLAVLALASAPVTDSAAGARDNSVSQAVAPGRIELRTGDLPGRSGPSSPGAATPPGVAQPPKSTAPPSAAAPSIEPVIAFGPPGDVGPLGIPDVVLWAYRSAANRVAIEQPSCHLPWWLLAGIGHTESGHAESGRVYADGTTRGRILGPVLDGGIAGDAVITDTDRGALDGDALFDRAVGPMQFIPSTWSRWGADGNGDGRRDPNNIFDATLAAGRYLCADGRDLATPTGIDAAILSYNPSAPYLRTVLAWATAYRDGSVAVPGLQIPVIIDVTAARPPLRSTPPQRPAGKVGAGSGTPATAGPTVSSRPPSPATSAAPPTAGVTTTPASSSPAPSSPAPSETAASSSPAPSDSPQPTQSTVSASPTATATATRSTGPTASDSPTSSCSIAPTATGEPTGGAAGGEPPSPTGTSAAVPTGSASATASGAATSSGSVAPSPAPTLSTPVACAS
jgi:membrane-bound lytic murein transglycosylase B